MLIYLLYKRMLHLVEWDNSAFETKNFFFLNVKIIAANLAYLVTTGVFETSLPVADAVMLLIH
jgi:hypothetical protein